MTELSAQATPAAPLTSRRIRGIDMARGIALFAMMATHLIPLTDDAGEATWALIFAGRASALFAVLAGVGISLANRPTDLRAGGGWARAAAGLAGRGLVIIAIGLTLGIVPSGIAVILVYYGVMFVLAGAFVRLPAAVLGLGALVWMLAAPVVSHAVRAAGGDQFPSMHGTVPSWLDLARPIDLLTDLLVNGYYPALTWFGYILLGMFVGRLDFRRPVAIAGWLVVGVGVSVAAKMISTVLLESGGYAELVKAWSGGSGTGLFYGTLDYELLISGYGVTPTDSWWWLASSGPHSGTPFDLLHTAGLALAIICLCLLIESSLRRGGTGIAALAVLWAPGSMPLTIYSAHVIGFAILPREPIWLLVHIAAAIGFALVWRRVSQRGPLESAARSASEAAKRLVPRSDGA